MVVVPDMAVHAANFFDLANQPCRSLAGQLPALTAKPDGGANLDQSSPAGQGRGLSQGAIAGIVLGSIAAAALITTLLAFIVIKVHLPALETYHCMRPGALLHLAPEHRDSYAMQAEQHVIPKVHVCRQRDPEDTSVCRRPRRQNFWSITVLWTGK